MREKPIKLYIDGNGNRFETDGSVYIMVWPEGGGRALQMELEHFKREFREATDEEIRGSYTKKKVYLESVYTETEAYVSSRPWNGWAVPFFTKENADKLVSEAPELLEYDSQRDRYVCIDDSQETEEEFEAEYIETEDGRVKVYGIGAGSWVWDVADED